MSLPENKTYGTSPSIPKFTGALGSTDTLSLIQKAQWTQANPTELTPDIVKEVKSADYNTIFGAGKSFTFPSFGKAIEPIDEDVMPDMSNLQYFDQSQGKMVPIDSTIFGNVKLQKDPITWARYYEDITDPSKIIISQRASDMSTRYNERQGLSRFDTEIDHIIPLWLGGEDSASNKQRLSLGDHTRKTTIDALMREMVYNKVITPSQARSMYGKWRTLDTSGLLTNPYTGDLRLSEEQAKRYSAISADDKEAKSKFVNDIYKAWQVNAKPSIEPSWARSRREGISNWIEDKFGEKQEGSPVITEDLIKGFVTGLSNDWIKTVTDKDDQNMAAIISQSVGNVGGTLTNMLIESALLAAASAGITAATGVWAPAAPVVGTVAFGMNMLKNVPKVLKSIKTADQARDYLRLLKSTGQLAKTTTKSLEQANMARKGLESLARWLKILSGTSEVKKNVLIGTETAKMTGDVLKGANATANFAKTLQAGAGIKIKPNTMSQILANVPLFMTQGVTNANFWEWDTSTKMKISISSALNGLTAGAFDPITKPLSWASNKIISNFGSSALNNYLGDAATSFAIGLYDSEGDMRAAAENALLNTAFQLFFHGNVMFSRKMGEYSGYIRNLEQNMANKVLNDNGIKLSLSPDDFTPKNRAQLEEKLTNAYNSAVQQAVKAQQSGVVPSNEIENQLSKITAALQSKYKLSLTKDELAKFNSENAKSIGKILERDLQTKNQPVIYNVPGKPDLETFLNSNFAETIPPGYKFKTDASLPNTSKEQIDALAHIFEAKNLISKNGVVATSTGHGLEWDRFTSGVNMYKTAIDYLNNIPDAEKPYRISNKIILAKDTSPTTQTAISQQQKKLAQDTAKLMDEIESLNTKLNKIDPTKKESIGTVTEIQQTMKAKQDEIDLNLAKLEAKPEDAVAVYAIVYDGAVNNTLQLTPRVLNIGYIVTDPKLKTKEGLDFYVKQETGRSLIQDNVDNTKVFDALNKSGSDFMLVDMLWLPKKEDVSGLYHTAFVLPKNYKELHSVYNKNYENSLKNIQANGMTNGGVKDFTDTVELLGVNVRTQQLDKTLTALQTVFEADLPVKTKRAKLKEVSTIFDDVKTANAFLKNIDNATIQDLITVLDNKISRMKTFNTKDFRVVNDAMLLKELNSVFSSPLLYTKDGKLNRTGKTLLNIPLVTRTSRNNVTLAKFRSKIANTDPEKVALYNKVKQEANTVANNKASLNTKPSTIDNNLQLANKISKITKNVTDGKIEIEDVAKMKTISSDEVKLFKLSNDPATKQIGKKIEDIRNEDIDNLDSFETISQNLGKTLSNVIKEYWTTPRAPRASAKQLVNTVAIKASTEGISWAPKLKQSNLLDVAPKKEVVEMKPEQVKESITKVEKEDLPKATTYNIKRDTQQERYIPTLEGVQGFSVKNIKELVKSATKKNPELRSEEFVDKLMDSIRLAKPDITPKQVAKTKKEIQKIFNKTITSWESYTLAAMDYIKDGKITRPVLKEMVNNNAKPLSPMERFIESNPKYKDAGVKIVGLDNVNNKIKTEIVKADTIRDLTDIYATSAKTAGYIPLMTGNKLENIVFIKAPKEWDGKKFDIYNTAHLDKFLNDFIKDMGFDQMGMAGLKKRINLLYVQDPHGNPKDKIKVISIPEKIVADTFGNISGALFMPRQDIKAIGKDLWLWNATTLKPVFNNNKGTLIKGQIFGLDYWSIKALDKKHNLNLNKIITDAQDGGYRVVITSDDNIKQGSGKFSDINGVIKSQDMTGDNVYYKLKKDDLLGDIGDKSFGISIGNKLNSDVKDAVDAFAKMNIKNMDEFLTMMNDIFTNPGDTLNILQNSKYKNKLKTDKIYGIYKELMESGADILTLDKRFGNVLVSTLGEIARNPIKNSAYAPLEPDLWLFKFQDGTSGKLQPGEIAISQGMATKLNVKNGDHIGAIRYPVTTRRAISDVVVKILDDKHSKRMWKSIAASESDVFNVWEGDFDGDHLSLFDYKEYPEMETIIKTLAKERESKPLKPIKLSDEDKIKDTPITYQNIIEGIAETAENKTLIGKISNEIGVANILYDNKTPIQIWGKTYTPKYSEEVDDKWRYILQAAVDAQKYSTLSKMQDFEKNPVAIMYGINDSETFKDFKKSSIYQLATKWQTVLKDNPKSPKDTRSKPVKIKDYEKSTGRQLNIANLSKKSFEKSGGWQEMESYLNIAPLPKGEGATDHALQIINNAIKERFPKMSTKINETNKQEIMKKSASQFKEKAWATSMDPTYSTPRAKKLVSDISKYIIDINTKISQSSQKWQLRQERAEWLKQFDSMFNALNNKEKTYLSLQAITNPRLNINLWVDKWIVKPSKWLEPDWDLILPKHKTEFFSHMNTFLNELGKETQTK